MKYRKLPVEIEAVKFDGFEWVDDVQQPMFDGSFDSIPEWLVDAMAKSSSLEGSVALGSDGLVIHTLEGTMQANPGDYIIRGIKGEIYPCKPDIFTATYEAVQ